MAGQQYEITGGTFGTFVTPDSNRKRKIALAPQFDSTNNSALTCKGLPDDQLQAWKTFYASWVSFFNADDGFWTAGAEADELDTFELQLQQWQKQLQTTCQLAGPNLVTQVDLHKAQTESLPVTPKELAVGAAIVLGTFLGWKLLKG